MHWSFHEPHIDKMDGFTEETDIFGYEPFGQGLADLLGTVPDDPVLLVDGDWGTGKTVFARQWAGLLRQRGHAVLYFDAFSSDFQNDAFLAIIDAVYHFAVAEGLPTEVRASFSAKAARAAAIAFARGVGRGLVPGLDLVGMADEIGQAMEQNTSQLETWINNAQARREAVEDFQTTLLRLAEAAIAGATAGEGAQPASEDANRTGSNGPPHRRFVVIVDELDRCKPDFALDVLERIKHVFGSPGVAFVLVTNFPELQQSVKGAYGDVAAERYLEKFFDLRVQLPEQRSARHSPDKTRVYARRLWSEVLKMGGQGVDTGFDALCSLAASERLTLRTMEHVVRNVMVLAAVGGRGFSRFGPAGVLISFIRVTQPELFRRIERGAAKETEAEIMELKFAALRRRHEMFQKPMSDQELRKKMGAELKEPWNLQSAAQALSSFSL